MSEQKHSSAGGERGGSLYQDKEGNLFLYPGGTYIYQTGPGPVGAFATIAEALHADETVRGSWVQERVHSWDTFREQSHQRGSQTRRIAIWQHGVVRVEANPEGLGEVAKRFLQLQMEN